MLNGRMEGSKLTDLETINNKNHNNNSGPPQELSNPCGCVGLLACSAYTYVSNTCILRTQTLLSCLHLDLALNVPRPSWRGTHMATTPYSETLLAAPITYTTFKSLNLIYIMFLRIFYLFIFLFSLFFTFFD